MSRSKTSKAWLKEHFDDKFVQQSQKDGYRSRAAYKLIELNDKDRLIQEGMMVVDLGSAPGGWSQIAANMVGHTGRVVASDILPMDSYAGVEFVLGDFTEEAVYDEIVKVMNNQLADVVISDMAPNMSGVSAIDQPQSMYLVELALEMARQVLKPGGDFVAKVFHGEGFDEYIKDVRTSFSKVVMRKPDSSRARSKETYVVGKGFKG